MYYVGISGITDADLGFMGYTLVGQNDEFKMYQDYRGEVHIVDKESPMLKVDDVNDAQALAQRSSCPSVVNMP